MDTLLARHTPSICLQCRDGVHRCQYGDDMGDCYRKGTPMVANDSQLIFACREHGPIILSNLERV